MNFIKIAKVGKICGIGTLSGIVIDHYLVSKDEFVNFGHRENINGSSIYQALGDMCIFPPIGIPMVAFMLWLSPGIYINRQIDKFKYPDRWNTTYNSPAYSKYLLENPIIFGGGGTGNPQITFF